MKDERAWKAVGGLNGEIAWKLVFLLARTKTRPDLFRETPDPARMIGLVVGRVLHLLEEWQVEDCPSQRRIAEHHNLEPGQVSNFTRGRASTKSKWIDRGQAILKYLICGADPPKASLHTRAAFEMLDEVLFRERRNDGCPKFFRRERLNHGTPWSHRELANEIRCLTGYAAACKLPGRIVWVSGGDRFLPGEATFPRIRDAHEEALRAGVPVMFVHPLDRSSPAAASVEGFARGLDPSVWVPNGVLSQVPVQVAGPSFLTPAFQFVYVETQFNGKPEEELWLTRGVDSTNPPDQEEAVTYGGREPECKAFREWLLGLPGMG